MEFSDMKGRSDVGFRLGGCTNGQRHGGRSGEESIHRWRESYPNPLQFMVGAGWTAPHLSAFVNLPNMADVRVWQGGAREGRRQ